MNGREDPSRKPIIRGERLSKAYRNGSLIVPVFTNLSLRVLAGEFVAVLGVSGSGKTTLLNLLGGIDYPESGVLTVCGVSLSGASQRMLASFRRDNIGFVFQAYNLLPTLTARENVEAALEVMARYSRNECRERAEHFLNVVGLSDRLDAFPAELSSGQQQRVAVARALSKEPPVFLADEPTGNLDQKTARDMWSLMLRLNQQSKSVFLVVTHDSIAGSFADQVFEIDEGLLKLVDSDTSPGLSASELQGQRRV
jgi:putative ABC transport system ATP-binding protein